MYKWVILSLLGIICSIISVSAQVVTAEPEFPTVSDSVIIYFDATKGNQELKDYNGDIYAHTGVITTASVDGTDWKHVIADWDVNTDKAKEYIEGVK